MLRKLVELFHRQHTRREQAQVLVLFAIGGVALVSMIGLAVDGGNIFVHRRVVQTSADTAALAAARELSQVLGATTVAQAACMYARTNTFAGEGADSTELLSAEYVDINGAGLGTMVNTGACPTPASNVCTVPPLSNCGSITTNTPPATSAGVKARTRHTFDTYFFGILGFGTYTVEAEATARVESLSTFASGSPFIVCGTNMTAEDHASNVNSTADGGINNLRWANIANAPAVEAILLGVGPYTLNTAKWNDFPPGPVATYPPAGKSFTPPPVGTTPGGPGYVLHGTDVKTTCGTSNKWKGLSCVSDASCDVPPNPSATELLLTLPAPATNIPPYTQLADGTNGNKVGLAANTVGPNGCGPGVVQRCISILPVASIAPPGSDDGYAAHWGAFWLDDCYGAPSANTVTCGWFLGTGYTNTQGNSVNDWTYGTPGNGGVHIIKLVL